MTQPADPSMHQAAAPAVSLGSYTDRDWDITTGVGFTALAVAAGRAMETHRPDRLVTDPHAAAFVYAAQATLPLPTTWPPDTTPESSEAAGQGVDELWAGMATYLGVRTRFFDRWMNTACQREGIRQVVLLAAGLDARAVRLDWPEGTRVFEIDHPQVLAFKDQVLDHHGAQPSCDRRVVGVDLRDDWPAALQQAGFDPTRKTAWLAEGLLFYLPDEDTQQLVDRVHALSAPGSRWASESIADPAAAMTALRDNTALQHLAAQFGADPTTLWPPEQQWEPHTWMVHHGWTVTAAAAHTIAGHYHRTLDGPMGRRDHPSVLLSANCEPAEDDSTPG